MSRTIGVIVLLLFGVAVAAYRHADAQGAASDLGTSSPLMWRAFEPLIVGFGDGSAERAVSYLREASSILRKLDAELQRDGATEAFRQASLQSFEDFDLGALHALLPHAEPDGFRAFTFEGAPTARAYRVRAGMREPAGVPRAFGASYGVLRMRRAAGEDERRYLLQLRGGAGLGSLRWRSLLAGAVNAGALLEPPTAEDLPMAIRAADAFVAKRQPNLGASDRRILALFWASYPAAAKVILPISFTDDVVIEDAIPGLAKLHLVTGWDLEGMGARYPELARYLRELGSILDVRVRLLEAGGNTLGGLHTDTKSVKTRVSAVLQNGALVATRTGSTDVIDAGFEHMRLLADVQFVLHRLHFAISKLQLDVRYREHDHGFELRARVVGKPEVRVTGAAFGIVPTHVLDWFIPGDTEGIARRMLAIAVSGNEGRGMRFGLRFDESASGATVDWDFETELLDSKLVRFCMRVMSEAAVPDEAQQADIRRLSIAYRDAFDEDLERYAKFGPRMH